MGTCNNTPFTVLMVQLVAHKLNQQSVLLPTTKIYYSLFSADFVLFVRFINNIIKITPNKVFRASQGSILGPVLSNVSYDSLLGTNTPFETCTTVDYTDDMAGIIVVRNIEQVQLRLCKELKGGRETTACHWHSTRQS